jgi:hypothetical protein
MKTQIHAGLAAYAKQFRILMTLDTKPEILRSSIFHPFNCPRKLVIDGNA